MAFEVKTLTGKLSKLQEITINQINETGSVAIKVTSLQKVKKVFEEVMPEK